MPRAVQLNEAPKIKSGLPEYPKFIIRTTPVQHKRTRKWKALWLCKCGTEFESFVDNVARRHTTSCGCELDKARRMSFPTHGHSKNRDRSLTYKSWQAMIARCTNPKHPAFHYYGGRGITICDEWLADFKTFLRDVGERPEGLTLDRINTNGNYEPNNCRWVDFFTQNRNRRPRKRAQPSQTSN